MDAKVIKACILGLAVGDALGVPAEFKYREELDKNPVTDMEGYGTYNVTAGSWSDDTSMTLCTLESLTKGRLDLDDVMHNFIRWYNEAEFTPTGETFDIGNTCGTAIKRYLSGEYSAEHCGLTGSRSNGNGSLMRIIPAVLYSIAAGETKNHRGTWETVSRVSALTHAHPRSITACEIYACVLERLIEKPEKESVGRGIDFHRGLNAQGCEEYSYFKRVDADVLKSLSRDEIKSSGYVVDTLEAALWCLLTTDSYKECVLKAVNLGEDTDTVAAVAGGLAGALYGYGSIPEEWLDRLLKRDCIEDVCERAAKAWK